MIGFSEFTCKGAERRLARSQMFCHVHAGNLRAFLAKPPHTDASFMWIFREIAISFEIAIFFFAGGTGTIEEFQYSFQDTKGGLACRTTQAHPDYPSNSDVPDL